MVKNKSGFTLIELLVVIAIIGLLSTLSILALNTARARARDTKRVADVKQIQTALEMYYNDTGSYPVVASVDPGDSIYTINGTYLKQVPYPPTIIDGSLCVAQPAYTYAVTNTTNLGGIYTIAYCLGGPVNDVAAGPHTATQSGIK